MFGERGNFELMEIQISKWLQGARKKSQCICQTMLFKQEDKCKKLAIRSRAESAQFAGRSN